MALGLTTVGNEFCQ